MLLWIPLLPFAGFLLNNFGARALPKRVVGAVASAAMLAAFAVAAMAVGSLGSLPAEEREIVETIFTWIGSADFQVPLGLRLDPLSAVMILIITGIGFLIHLYSTAYMTEEEPSEYARYFAYLNLFAAFMLLLVLGDNLVVMFVGWEGVGLCSYLLIGFWYPNRFAADAGKKAFIVNRIGDVAFILGVLLAFSHFGSVNFKELNGAIAALPPDATFGVVSAIALLLFIGATGKSAQIPLYTWLPDAMEGPTPVSALIHAATMVTAGVYLITRSNFIFELAPTAQTAVVVVAVVTLLWGAIIGCAKDDIKKVLAGSTMSQIGYMMLGAGLGVAGYAFAIFHLLTHGFFKANMFLGAGSVMHAMDDDVDMRHYGALQKMVPITCLTFAMGYLAIIGFPGFSGFWSKDKIIETALAESWVVGLFAILGAGITGFYMTRLMLMTFFTKKRWPDGVHPHESPRVMTIPLIVLAALSVLGGVMLIGDWIVSFLAPVVGEVEHHEPPLPALVLTLIVVLVVAAGVALAWLLVGKREVPREAPAKVSFATRAARHELYGDAINDALVVNPGRSMAGGLTTMDRVVVDGVVEGGSAAVGGFSSVFRRVQNGFVRSYALSVLGGVLLIVLALLAVNLA
jgi:NADH-quinone oxidoreductase subunit L